MAAPVTVPRLGWSMEEGVLLEWLKQDGDLVRPGDALFVLESEKAAEQIEAIDGGILHIGQDAPKPGDRVQVGQVLGYLAAEGETIAVPSPTAPQATIATPEPVAAAGPAARRLARTMNVDLHGLSGSGPGGRITETDVRQHKREGEAPGEPQTTAVHGSAGASPSHRRHAPSRSRRALGGRLASWASIAPASTAAAVMAAFASATCGSRRPAQATGSFRTRRRGAPSRPACSPA